MRVWARRLLATEATNRSESEVHGYEATRICEELRSALAPCVGATGFSVFLSRALILASADVPSLKTAKVGADGLLERTETYPPKGRRDCQEAIAITGHLLGLLAIFIGESLMLRLIGKAFPAVTNHVVVEPEEDQ